MKANWICVICGTTISSKCPDSRSEFYGHAASIARMVTTINRVDSVKNDLSELFISYTTGKETPTHEAIKNLYSILLDEPGVLESITCNHVFVINSTEETQCVLDHTHPNLNDADRLRDEITANKPKQTVKEMLRGYASVANTAIELARRDVNITKDKFDHRIEEEFHAIKQYIRDAFLRLCEDRTVRPTYKICIHGREWRNPESYVTFWDKNAAVAFMLGMLSMGHTTELLKLRKDGSGYDVDTDVDLVRYCCCCGKPMPLDGEIIVQLQDGQAHYSCARKLDDKKEKPRKSKLIFWNELRFLEPGLKRAQEIMPYATITCTGSRHDKTTVTIQMTTTAEGLKQACSRLRELL